LKFLSTASAVRLDGIGWAGGDEGMGVMRSLLLTLIFLTVIAASASAITFDDGLTHTIDSENSFPFEGATLNYPPGLIADIQGTIIGTLADGSPINIPFGRASTATMTVPEMAREAGTLVALAAIAAVETRTRRLERFDRAGSKNPRPRSGFTEYQHRSEWV
jgi:hypothetical protein